MRLIAAWQELLFEEHFRVDGTLIEAWASQKSFRAKDEKDPPNPGEGRNAEVDFKGEKRCNDTHASSTDPEARMVRKSGNTAAKLCHMDHVLIDNRTALMVDVDLTEAHGTAERESALRMLKRSAPKAKSLDADKNYDTATFGCTCPALGLSAHVAAKNSGSAPDRRTTRHETYRLSQRIGKRIEGIFSWLKSVGGLRTSPYIGRAQLAAPTLLGCVAHNLVRFESLNGWWDARHR